jgi:hypothetical protein
MERTAVDASVLTRTLTGAATSCAEFGLHVIVQREQDPFRETQTD